MELKENDLMLHRYRLLTQIGKGGYSVVWKAYDEVASLEVAIKIYAPDKGLDEKGIQQFANEYRLTQPINHTNLLKSTHYDVVSETNAPFLVMPFCQHGSLGAFLYDNEKLSEDIVAKLMVEIGSGLAYLHQQNPPILHQDIKPDNVLIGNDGQYLLTDFGISNKMRSTLRKSTVGEGRAMTVAYAPPEKYTNKGISTSSDIFSFGIMLYECLTNDVPWGGEGGIVLLRGAHLPDLSSEYPERLNAVIKACLNTDQDQRPTAKQISRIGEFYQENGFWPKPEDFLDTTSNQKTQAEPADASNGRGRKTQFISNDDLVKEQQTQANDDRTTSKAGGVTKMSRSKKLIAAPIILAVLAFGTYFSLTTTTQDTEVKLQQALNNTEENNSGLESGVSEAVSPKPAAPEEKQGKASQPQKTPQPSTTKKEEKISAAWIASTMKWRNTMDRGNNSEAFYRKEAASLQNNSNSEALARLGYLFRLGKGVKKDFDKAIELFSTAADNGNAFGQYNLGFMYDLGQGVTQDYKKAIYWYQKSAEQGDPYGQNNLGSIYHNGNGVARNYDKAMFWFLKSAEQGNDVSQYNLGKMYREGNGVPKNYEKAVFWYKKAAEQGYADAQFYLGLSYQNGEGVAKNYKEAIAWYQKAANQNNEWAQYNLGVMYYQGKGVDENDEKALYLFRKAAEKNHSNAEHLIGQIYDKGHGVEINWIEAFKWYKKAAEGGSSIAQTELGTFYYFGVAGVEQNETEAIKWFKKAADGGNTKAKTYLKVISDMIDMKGQSSVSKVSSNGDRIEVTYTYEKPVVMSKLGNSWEEKVTFQLKDGSRLQVWPASSAIFDEKQDDEILFTNYSPSDTYTGSGEKKVRVSSKKPYRTIGYYYIAASLNNETIVIKLPVAFCWQPE